MDSRPAAPSLTGVTRLVLVTVLVSIPSAFMAWWQFFSGTPPWDYLHKQGVPLRFMAIYSAICSLGMVISMAYLWLIRRRQKQLSEVLNEAWSDHVELVHGHHFTNEKVILDRKRFRECVFTNCTL